MINWTKLENAIAHGIATAIVVFVRALLVYIVCAWAASILR